MEEKYLNVRSEEVLDILSRPPRKLVNWGSSVILIIILLVVIGSFYFKYPDKVECNITITTSTPPIWIVTRTSGKIKKIYKCDKQFVKKGEVIAVIDNSAETEEVFSLKNELSKVYINNKPINNIKLQYMNLGEIQSSYTSFIKAFLQYNIFFHADIYRQKIYSEKTQLKAYQNYIHTLEKQIHLSKKQSIINKNNFEREKKLFKENLSSKSALENAEQTYLSSIISTEQINSNISNAKIQLAQIKNTILELELQQKKEKEQNYVTLKTALNELITTIKQWEQSYILRSPINGYLSYNNVWKENQNVISGEQTFSVIDKNASYIIGKIQMPISG